MSPDGIRQHHIRRISDTLDPALEPFKTVMRSPGTGDRHFVAEGRILVEQLARAGTVFEAVLVAESLAAGLESRPGPLSATTWLVAPCEVINSVCGFRFHGGMLGLGARPRPPALADILRPLDGPDGGQIPMGIVVCPETANQDNLGALARSARAFGMAAVLAAPGAGDPYSRRCLRLSMGATLAIPVVAMTDAPAGMDALRRRGFALLGASLSPGAVPFETVDPPARFALVFGHEARGLTPELERSCTGLVRIEMADGQDSLNVAVAGGILMHHFGRRLITRSAAHR